jgi:hypothetical protein
VAENRVEKINRFEIYLKTTPFWLSFIPPRTGPDPTHTKTVLNFFFFWLKMGTLGVCMQPYLGSIRTHEVPGTGTARFLPYRCFLG